MSKRILIVGASFLQVPMIKKAKEMGLYVGVVDYNPEAVGIQFADEYFNCSTIDQEGLLSVAIKFKPDGIATMATDMPMRSIAYVCTKLGLNSISEKTAYLATNKIEMIKQFKKDNIASPCFAECGNFHECLNALNSFESYPLIFKPSDSSGSRGVIKVNNYEEAKDAFYYAQQNSKDNKVIIEDFMVGPEVSVECFSVDGVVNILQVTDKLTTGAPHFVEVGHIQPSSLDKKIVEKIKLLAISACKSLGINNGPAHAEIIVTKDGPKMVEIGARMGGDCITSDLVPLSTGIDMIKATLDYSLNNLVCIKRIKDKIACIKFIISPVSVINEVIIPKVNDIRIKKIDITTKSGLVNTNLYSSNDRIGYVICAGENREEIVFLSDNFITNIKYK